MKRNSLIVVIGVLLVIVFAFWLCAFQVRTTEVAVVTTFGKPTRPVNEPGLYFKLPPPIQRVYKFDQRIQSSEFENKFREDLTSDGFTLLTSVYVGWRITEPGVFLQKFPGGIPAVEQQLGTLISTPKSAVIGKHPLSDLVSATTGGSKFGPIEDEILASVESQLHTNDYGINIEFLGFKKIGLPETTTDKVFGRMTEERNKLVSAVQYEGESQAKIIRSDADLRASKILSAAQGVALRIQGEGQTAAAQYLGVFQQNPELASFLFRLTALEDSLKDKSTLIFDQQTEPFTLFKGSLTNSAAN
ncbi:MAG TPA: protease modulator HflC [Verrucomicrobiae bacterium]|jgi:membrane protease subunit HflC|nr:protease modulator HflC [Verrucomicrobiae bacterium]